MKARSLKLIDFLITNRPESTRTEEVQMNNLFEISLLALLVTFMALPVIINLVNHLRKGPDKSDQNHVA